MANKPTTNPPIAPCPPWCDRRHPAEPKGALRAILHSGQVGTGRVQDEPLTVRIDAIEADGRIGYPGVAIRWPYHGTTDGLPEYAPASGLDGIDMTPNEAEVLAALLVQAAVTIRTAGRS